MGDITWFNDARFGLFVHWGLYAIPARGEWVMHDERIPVAEYEPLAAQFNPTAYDPDAWVSLAKEAGMRYAVLTTRHHDGFCLYDSKVSDYTSVKTAAKRDLVGEYVEACRRGGLRVGFYYSLLDWHHPGCGLPERPDGPGWPGFVDYVHAQIRELLTQYGPVDVLWLDGHWPTGPEGWRANDLLRMVHDLQPSCLVNDRSGLQGDFETPEQFIPTVPPTRPWESCLCIGQRWGYYQHDTEYKTATRLIRYLVLTASGGGNLLLNVGPMADGTIPAPQVERLGEVGRWLKVHGESIYGTQPSRLTCHHTRVFGATTVRDNVAYLHLFLWQPGQMVLAGLTNKVLAARCLTTGEMVRFEQRGDRLFLNGLPSEPPDPHDTVIALELDGPPARDGLTR